MPEISAVGVEIQPKPREECGVLGIWLSEEGEAKLYNEGIELEVDGEQRRVHSIVDLGYIALRRQHYRGHQNTGMAVSVDGSDLEVVYGKGRPEQAFEDGNLLKSLPERARFLVGQNRYSTIGGSDGAQPVVFGNFAEAINGEFSNYRLLSQHNTRGDQPSDSWVHGSVVADRIDQSYTLSGALIKATEIAEGAFSIVAMHNGEMVSMRDPHGIRPLVFGNLRDWGHVSASETPTLRSIDALYERTVKPGEVLLVGDSGLQEIEYAESSLRHCSLERIYLADEEHMYVQGQRYHSGKVLAKEAPVRYADMVVPILGSAAACARGYADKLGLRLVPAIRKINDDRAFMSQEDRKAVVRGKIEIDLEAIKDKVVVIVDDSRVRGDTSEVICEIMAKHTRELHIRFGSPRIVDNCYYGVDLKNRDELSAVRMTDEQYREITGVKSIKHLSLQGLHKAYGRRICTGCFTGQYPTTVPETQHEQAASLVY